MGSLNPARWTSCVRWRSERRLPSGSFTSIIVFSFLGEADTPVFASGPADTPAGHGFTIRRRYGGDQPDAGLWELRGKSRVHTFSSVMCWAACHRLALIARHLGLADRAAYWQEHADHIHGVVCQRTWDAERNSFVSTFDGDAMDASLLLLSEVGFLAADDPRFASTVAAVEKDLRRGDYIFRYVEADDFGQPENAFIVCTYWYVNALSAMGRREEARTLFEKLLTRRNHHGLLAEHIDPVTGELWGNFVQTYSMVGLISAAIRLSVRWDQAF